MARVRQVVKTVKGAVTVREVNAELGLAQTVLAELAAAAGDDAPPLPDDRVILVRRSESGAYVAVGVIDPKYVPLAAAGERRLYGRDDAGVEKSFVWLKGDGVLELNGDTDFAVAFSKLKTEFDKLNAAFNAHTHAGVQLGAGTTPTGLPQSAAAIDNVKVPTVKLP